MRYFASVRGRFCAAMVLTVSTGVLTACGGGGRAANSPLPPSQVASTPSTPPASGDQMTTINVTQGMIDSLPTFTNFKYKIFPVRSDAARQTTATVFPLQLKDHGGPHLASAQNHEVFVNTTAAAVGNPQTFQTNFSNSTFVHVLDQYVGSTTNNRYPVNATLLSATISVFSNLISQNQLFTVLHTAVATTHLSGNGHIYNLFLKPGLDTCFDFGSCYSPDVPSQFAFCAYHGSITFSDVGHVIFTVIPFQHTPGCGDDLSGLTPLNAVPIDDTATTLSHEESEAITDPDTNGWFNDQFGLEVADNCGGFRATEALNGHNFLIQPEYSNAAGACFF
jgi:hypothetical protein